MSATSVALQDRRYVICTERSYAALPRALRELRLGSHAWIVTHRSLLARHGTALIPLLERSGFSIRTITIPESERAKSLAVAEQVMRRLAMQSAMRIPLLLAFGGGVVGDLTGFVAAVFRRGVPYVQLPTTLLAQVDSAIGGKVAVDVPFAKNLVGAFYQPRLVFNHLGLLTTLPPRQRRSGLSEVIKYGVMADPALFRFLETRMHDCLAGAPRADALVVERCSRIKARVVSLDERETRGVRIQLNFGHTLGHALEAATGYRRFTHGEAIAIGMACASALGVALGVTPRSVHQRVLAVLAAAGLPTTTSGVPLAVIRRALAYDKKFVGGSMRWVLATAIGRVVVHNAVTPALVWKVIRQHVRPGWPTSARPHD